MISEVGVFCNFFFHATLSSSAKVITFWQFGVEKYPRKVNN